MAKNSDKILDNKMKKLTVHILRLMKHLSNFLIRKYSFITNNNNNISGMSSVNICTLLFF